MPRTAPVSNIGNIVHIYNTGEELEGFNKDLLGMIDHSYDGVCIADHDSRILLLNQAFEKVMGLPMQEAIGRRISYLVSSGFTDTAATLTVLETGRESTVSIRTRAGRQVLSTGVPVYNRDQKISRVYCNIRDVTDLIRLREQYGASQRLASRYLHELQELKSSQTASTVVVTRNSAMQQVVDLAYRMSQVESNLLITGESGVGKDLLTRIVHEASPRGEKGSLVKVHCAAIPEQLLESELFGYEAGAFTGARKSGKVGYFEIADKGTLFLDEIGEMPLSLQVKLLNVLQDREIYRVGGTRPIPVDVRLVAATNRDLEEMVGEGHFREDLYYRLNVVPLKVPPLRRRVEDIPFLLAHFLEQNNKRHRSQIRLSQGAIESLCEYPWPGNVRELMNLVERLVVTSQNSVIEPDQLPSKYLAPQDSWPDEDLRLPRLKDAVGAFEEQLVVRALERCATREEAAARLGISLSSLSRRLARRRMRRS